MAVDWDYYNAQRFEDANEKYLPLKGEGEVMAIQICVCINKLVYKWYNDGDVFDNTHHLSGWANDLSSYANWLYFHVPGADLILEKISSCYTEDDYEDLLQKLADSYLNLDFLNRYATAPKIGSIYDCDGLFVFRLYSEDDEDEYWDDEDEDFEEDEEDD